MVVLSEEVRSTVSHPGPVVRGDDKGGLPAWLTEALGPLLLPSPLSPVVLLSAFACSHPPGRTSQAHVLIGGRALAGLTSYHGCPLSECCSVSLLRQEQMLPVPLRASWAQQKLEAQAGGTSEVICGRARLGLSV